MVWIRIDLGTEISPVPQYRIMKGKRGSERGEYQARMAVRRKSRKERVKDLLKTHEKQGGGGGDREPKK